MEKTKLALKLLNFCMKAMGFTEKPTQKGLDATEYCIDPQISKHIRMYFKTGVIATELILRLKEELGVIAKGQSVSQSFGTFTIGVTHLLNMQEILIKKFGPLDDGNDRGHTPPPAPQLSEIFAKLKTSDLPVSTHTRTKGFWCVYFKDPSAALVAFGFLQKIFPQEEVGKKLTHNTGEKAVKIHESLVITKTRKVKESIPKTAPQIRTKAKDSGLEDFAKQITDQVKKMAVQFVVQKTSLSEAGYQKKLERRFHLIDKTKSEVKIPVKHLNIQNGFIVLPIDVITKFLKKDS